MVMKQRFRLYRRNCGGRFYVQDGFTGKQESLGTTDRTEALRLLNAQIARAYLLACDPAIRTRTWQTVITEIVKARHGSTKLRYERAIQEKAFENIRTMPLLQTRPEHFMKVLPEGRKSTNDYLRRFHHFAQGMQWLPWPLLTRQQWPPIHREEKRGITWEEHQAIIAAEKDPERKAFYELTWHVGAAQIDIASLRAESIDWGQRISCHRRQKTGTPCVLRFGEEVTAILRRLPAEGPLFPKWS